MAKTKYWKTTITTVLLTEGPAAPDYSNLGEAAEDMIDGDASGVSEFADEEVTEDEMRQLLIQQGSDPEFLIQPEEEDDNASA